MKDSRVELQLLVNGKPVPTYGHDGRTFVEGREGTNFSLRVKNNTARRIEAVVSVDGRSVVDGETAGPTSRGYIIPAYGSYEIPGWRMDTEKCAKFIFKKGGESYAAKSGSNSSDVGVIGLMAWEEKKKEEPRQIIIKERIVEREPWPVWPYRYPTWPVWPYRYPTWPYPVWYSCSTNASKIQDSWATATYGATNSLQTSASLLGSAAPQGGGTMMSCCSAQASDVPAALYNCASDPTPTPSSAPSFDLGAGWGEATTSKISMTSFERGDVIVETSIFYSTAEALEKVGIRMVKEVAIPSGNQYPSAFKFCRPPGA